MELLVVFSYLFVSFCFGHFTYLYGDPDVGVQDIIKLSQIDYRIIGGELTSIKKVPYQVLYGRGCGASLLTPYWAITAAHCPTYYTHIYVGSTYRTKAKGHRICLHFVHPYWQREGNRNSRDYDYQLLLLERPVPITRYTRPIAIGRLSDIRSGVMASVSGWGRLLYKSHRHPEKTRMQDHLYRVFVPIINGMDCRKMSKTYRKITNRMFCAGYIEGKKDSCQGDSGSPIVVNNRLVGLVSYGVGCARPRYPGVYANVPRARKWIRKVTGLPL